MSVLILRIYQEVLVRSVGPCQTYEGSDVAVTFIDPGLSSTSKRAACVSDRVHALGNHVTCPGIRRHETSSNPGATLPRICYQSVGEFASDVEIGEGRRAWPKGGKWPGDGKESRG